MGAGTGAGQWRGGREIDNIQVVRKWGVVSGQ